MFIFKRVDNLEIDGYTDFDLTRCVDRKYTFDYIFMLAGGPISWKNKKQTLVTSFTMHAKFIACYVVDSHVV